MNAPQETQRFGSGQTVRRIEDPALVAGRGRYTDDLAPAGCTHLAFLRSPYAHARIVAIDSSAALAMPGVLAVYTGADLVQGGVKDLPPLIPFPRPDGKPGASALLRPMAHERVRYAGEALAAVVAETIDIARAAVDALAVDYDELPMVVDPMRAVLPGAPVLCEAAADNIASEVRHGNAEAVAAAFANAAHRVNVDVVNQRVAANPMEPRVILVQPESAPAADGGRWVVDISNQMPTGVRDSLAAALPGMSTERLRVRIGDVGGGFGMKGGIYPEDVVVAYAAMQLGRPVKWAAQRIEDFLSAMPGRDQLSRGEMALDADGRVLALRVRSVVNIGAYATTYGVPIPLLIGPWVTTSVYDIQAIDLQITAVMTNTTPTGAYRGAGRPEAIYLTERLMDAAARELKLDPAELRRRNLIRPEQMPYTNPMAQTYDVGQFEKMLDQCLALADWQGFAARRAQSEARGKLRGRGVSTFLEWTGAGALDQQALVNVLPEGVIEVICSTQAMGQGIATSFAQLAVDVFEVPIERIRVVQGDTDRVNGMGSAGSRSLFTGGSAVRLASEKAVKHAKDLAAEALEAAASDIEYRAGRFQVTGTDLGIDLFELAGRQAGAHILVDATASAKAPSWPNACHIGEVEIDPATGEVEIVAYASVNDIGRVISPAIVRGQIEGGAMQGIGQALCERIVYDGESGQLLTASFMDYAMPHADQFRGFKTEFDTSVPCLTNTLGAKGVGELGTIGATPTVVNAVVDALDHAGLGRDAERVQMPLTSEMVWRALKRDFSPPPLGPINAA